MAGTARNRKSQRETRWYHRERKRERESLRYAGLTHLLSSPPPPSQACYVDYRLACFATTIQLRIQMHVQITRLVSRAWKELAKRSVEDVGSSPSFCVFVRGGSDGIKFDAGSSVNSSEIRKYDRFVNRRLFFVIDSMHSFIAMR